jgi:hypothetical protein
VGRFSNSQAMKCRDELTEPFDSIKNANEQFKVWYSDREDSHPPRYNLRVPSVWLGRLSRILIGWRWGRTRELSGRGSANRLYSRFPLPARRDYLQWICGGHRVYDTRERKEFSCQFLSPGLVVAGRRVWCQGLPPMSPGRLRDSGAMYRLCRVRIRGGLSAGGDPRRECGILFLGLRASPMKRILGLSWVVALGA